MFKHLLILGFILEWTTQSSLAASHRSPTPPTLVGREEVYDFGGLSNFPLQNLQEIKLTSEEIALLKSIETRRQLNQRRRELNAQADINAQEIAKIDEEEERLERLLYDASNTSIYRLMVYKLQRFSI